MIALAERVETIPFVSLTGPTLERLEDLFARPVDAVPTPWPLWNAACQGMGGKVGLSRGWHVLVAGASGGAKTFTALNLCHAAVLHGEKVAMYSLEMDWTEVGARWMAIASGEPAWKLGPGAHFSRSAFRAAAERVNEARGSMLVNQHPIRTLREIVTAVRRNAEDGATVHVVDYLQLAWVNDASSMYERISEVSHEVRALAKELRLVSIGLSQLNRAGNGEESPRKEAMAGSSSLENDADQVLLLDHTKRRPVDNEMGKRIGWFGWAMLDKNRHGPQEKIPIAFSFDTFRMRERDADEIDAEELKPKVRG
jgi:replicative DNA helicase